MMNSMFIFELGTKFQLKRKDTLEIKQSAIVGNNQGNGEINEWVPRADLAAIDFSRIGNWETKIYNQRGKRKEPSQI